MMDPPPHYDMVCFFTLTWNFSGCVHRYVRPGQGFVPNFQLFESGDVNGKNEQSVFTFLKVMNDPSGNNNPNLELKRLSFHRSPDPNCLKRAQSLQSYRRIFARQLQKAFHIVKVQSYV